MYRRVALLYGPSFGSSLDGSVPMVFFSLFAALFMTVAVAFFILRRSFSVRSMGAMGVLYVAVLLLVLFGKSIGVSGLNLNPMQFEGLTAGFVLNVLIFVLPGFFLGWATGGTLKAIAVGAAASVLVEVVQFAFYLGIADIYDVFANVLGVLLGALLYQLALHCGFCIGTAEGKMRFERCAREALENAADLRDWQAAKAEFERNPDTVTHDEVKSEFGLL